MQTYNDDEIYGSTNDENNPFRSASSRSRSRKIAIAAVAVVAFIAAGIFVAGQFGGEEEIAAVEVPVNADPIAQLNQLEANKDYLNIIKALNENVDPEFSKVVLPWLQEREASGFAPYLYAAARHYLITGDAYQALLYYSTAGLTARIDAARCTDRSTAGFVAYLENGFSGVQQYIKANPDSMNAAGTWALLKEDETKNRALPEWLCTNGDNPSEYVPYVSEEIWQGERAQIRTAFEQFVAQSGQGLATTSPASGEQN